MKFQTQDLLAPPKFKSALEYRDTFTFGHEKIDSVLELHLDDIVGIFGETRFSNALITRLVVRSLLPRNHGGVDAKNVIVIDADNSSSPYLYVDFARQYGMHHKSVLHKVIISRQFTIYQLAHTIIYDLQRRVQLHKPKVVVISGLLDQFSQDPYVNTNEAERLLLQIVTALCKIEDVFVIITSRFPSNRIEFPALSKFIEIRDKKEFSEKKLNFSIRNNGRLKRVSMIEAELVN